jgi:uncharacterized protein
MTWQLVLTGLLIGTLVGLTGMGGGSLMTPILVLVFGFSPSVAVGTDILHGAIFKTVGAARQRRLGAVSAQLSGWMFVGSAPMSLLGVGAAAWLAHRYGEGAQSGLRLAVGAALVVGAVGLFIKSFVRYRDHPDTFSLTTRDRVAAVLIGLLGGFVVGMTSVGSGVFFGLTMLFVFPLRSHKVVGTDIFHAAALLWVAGIGHMVAGSVDLGAVGWLVLGSVPGVLVGSQLPVRTPERRLRLLLGAVLLASGIAILDLPGRSWWIGAAAAAGLALVVVNEFVARGRTRARGAVA